MSIWITVYCRRPVVGVAPQQVLDGIRGRDPAARAGVDYWTLAEDYGVDDGQVEGALAGLSVSALGGRDEGFEIAYGGRSGPLFVRCWRQPARVAEEIREIAERGDLHPQEAVSRIRGSREVIGVELRPGHLGDMGVVLAYEAARYLAQKGEGLILNDQGTWLEVQDGAFELLA